jgi:hypothetical protein
MLPRRIRADGVATPMFPHGLQSAFTPWSEILMHFIAPAVDREDPEDLAGRAPRVPPAAGAEPRPGAILTEKSAALKPRAELEAAKNGCCYRCAGS